MAGPSDQDHDQAVTAAVAAAIAPLGVRYEVVGLDVLHLPDAGRPDDYVETSVTRRFGGLTRGGGGTSSTGWRITTRYVSHRFAGNARVMRSRVRDHLEDLVLQVGGHPTTAVLFETGDDIAPDDGWWSALDTWTYAVPKF